MIKMVMKAGFSQRKKSLLSFLKFWMNKFYMSLFELHLEIEYEDKELDSDVRISR